MKNGLRRDQSQSEKLSIKTVFFPCHNRPWLWIPLVATVSMIIALHLHLDIINSNDFYKIKTIHNSPVSRRSSNTIYEDEKITPTDSNNKYHTKINNNQYSFFNNKNHNNDDTTSKELLLNIVRDTGIKDEKTLSEIEKILPTWTDVTKRFGNEPKIVGLETCKIFNQSLKRKARYLGIAGPFNSGTHFLANLLQNNCNMAIKNPKFKGQNFINRILWQVPWGKHQSPKYRLNNSLYGFIRSNEDVLPIVIVRDPYSWMQSMCRNRYTAHWYHITPYHCPNLIPNNVEKKYFNKKNRWLRRHYSKDQLKISDVLDKANFTLQSNKIPVRVHYNNYNAFHDSLIHMWKDWYEDYYYNVTFPRIMIRLEDLVFHPRHVLSKICNCIDGDLYDDDRFTIEMESAKIGPNHGTNRTGLIDAMRSHVYGNRTKGMTQDDINFVEDTLQNSIMKKLFNYLPPD